MSKDFERILYKHIDTFMTTKFSPYQVLEKTIMLNIHA